MCGSRLAWFWGFEQWSPDRSDTAGHGLLISAVSQVRKRGRMVCLILMREQSAVLHEWKTLASRGWLHHRSLFWMLSANSCMWQSWGKPMSQRNLNLNGLNNQPFRRPYRPARGVGPAPALVHWSKDHDGQAGNTECAHPQHAQPGSGQNVIQWYHGSSCHGWPRWDQGPWTGAHSCPGREPLVGFIPRYGVEVTDKANWNISFLDQLGQ